MGDAFDESRETFAVKLARPKGAQLADRMGRGKVTDDDAPAACDDGLDNDNDGVTDTGDPGCTSPADTSELGSAACDDGLDNDNDGLSDFRISGGDPGCASPADTSELGNLECDDGLDNDSDGLIDFRISGPADPQCTSPSDTSEAS